MSRAATGSEAAIFDAAVALMAARGYHGTSLRDVAAAVGMQMSSLYHYFPGKQALLVAIMRRTMDDLAAAVRPAMQAEADPRERLAAGIRAHVRFHTERRAEALITDSEIRALEPEQRPAIVALRDAHQALFADALRAGMLAGVFEVADPRLASSALMAMCTGVADWYRPTGRLSPEQIAAQYAELFLRAVAARPAATITGDLHPAQQGATRR